MLNNETTRHKCSSQRHACQITCRTGRCWVSYNTQKWTVFVLTWHSHHYNQCMKHITFHALRYVKVFCSSKVQFKLWKLVSVDNICWWQITTERCVLFVPGCLSKPLELVRVSPCNANVFLLGFIDWWVHVIDNVLILCVNIASEWVKRIHCSFTRLWCVLFQQVSCLHHKTTPYPTTHPPLQHIPLHNTTPSQHMPFSNTPPSQHNPVTTHPPFTM